MEVARTITIDGVGFPVEFRGWHADLEVAEPPGRLRPWRLAAHAAALAACSDGEGLNAAQFADRVLESCWIGTGPGPRALALWWAAGAEPVEEDELEFGDVRVSLRRWSFGDRIRALEQAGAGRNRQFIASGVG
ncbi:MAG TPA: hypothetical protein PLA94_28990, partial [Myxococcota bacterium]|nr:hypothetical protein [Myxococcota bacterium]